MTAPKTPAVILFLAAWTLLGGGGGCGPLEPPVRLSCPDGEPGAEAIHWAYAWSWPDGVQTLVGYLNSTTEEDCEFLETDPIDPTGSPRDPRAQWFYEYEVMIDGGSRISMQTILDKHAVASEATDIEAVTSMPGYWRASARPHEIVVTMRQHPDAYHRAWTEVICADGSSVDFGATQGDVTYAFTPAVQQQCRVIARNKCRQFPDVEVPVWCHEWVGVEVMP
jgi:hypothetical protein